MLRWVAMCCPSIRSSTPGYPPGALAGEGGHRSDLAGKGGGEGRRGEEKGGEGRRRLGCDHLHLP